MGTTPQSVVGNLTWNANGTLQKLDIIDPFNAANTQTCKYGDPSANPPVAGYDDLGRLISGNCGSVWSQTFSYDAFKNITKSGSGQFQPGYNYQTNQMATGASYDTMGDVVNDGLHSYAWNSDTRPTTIDTATLVYDALGRMIEQSKAGANAEIVYDTLGNKLALMNGLSTIVKAFAPLPAGATAVYNASGLQYYRDPDWLGSSRFSSTPIRTMYNDLAFAPFGETYAASGSTGVTDISFAGNDEDTTVSLYDAQFREYGIQGRWPSPDPAGIAAANPANPQGFHRYAYVLNNSTNLVDPKGMQSMDCRKETAYSCLVAHGGNIPTIPNEDGEDIFSGTCTFSADCIFMGLTEFDAIAGSPGTYVVEDGYGNFSWGWDYGLYSVTMNMIDSLNSKLTPGAQIWGPTVTQTPDLKGQVPTTGYPVFVHDLGAQTEISGLIPDLISAFSALTVDSYFLSKAASPQSAERWARYVQYDVMIYQQTLENLFNFVAFNP